MSVVPLRVAPLSVVPLRVAPLSVVPLRVAPLSVVPLRVAPLRVVPPRMNWRVAPELVEVRFTQGIFPGCRCELLSTLLLFQFTKTSFIHLRKQTSSDLYGLGSPTVRELNREMMNRT